MASFIPKVMKFHFVDARLVGILGLGYIAYGISEFGVGNAYFRADHLSLPEFGTVSPLLTHSERLGESVLILENEEPNEDAKRPVLTAASLRNKKWRENNPEKYRAYEDGRRKEVRKIWEEKNKDHRQEYREKNKERISISRKEYLEKNKERISQKGKEYYEKNKKLIFLVKKDYREKNKERIFLAKKEYREKNKESIALKKRRSVELQQEKVFERWEEYTKSYKLFENLSKNKLNDEFEKWKDTDPELKGVRDRKNEVKRKWRARKKLEKKKQSRAEGSSFS